MKIDWGHIVSGLVAVISLVGICIKNHADGIKALMLRVEKDSEKGWTNEKKEDIVIELFFKYVYPGLPFYIKVIPEAWIKSIIRSIIKSLSDKCHVFKDRVGETKEVSNAK